MPKALVTQERVFEAADLLTANGAEASIIAVQERIGGGSYSTVKRYLDTWKEVRKTAPPSIELPAEIQSKGEDFIRSLWGVALGLAEQRIAEIQAEAERQVKQARADLAAAETAISRLEGEAEYALQHQELMNRELAQVRAELDEARTMARVLETRATEQVAQLADLRRQIESHSEELAALRPQAAEALRASGELVALRRQLDDQQALIERLTTHS